MNAEDRIFQLISTIARFHWRQGVTRKEAEIAFKNLIYLGMSLEAVIEEQLTAELLCAKTMEEAASPAKRAYDFLVEKVVKNASGDQLQKGYTRYGAKCFRYKRQNARYNAISGEKPYQYPWYKTTDEIRQHVADVMEITYLSK